MSLEIVSMQDQFPSRWLLIGLGLARSLLVVDAAQIRVIDSTTPAGESDIIAVTNKALRAIA
jgi:hypothetical protein